ncbi:MAG: calcium/sodium antiporter [Alphaproteobacteria bacterium]|nr:calcium/sodium antiporter [Alphaproteobacteria bacterium]
MTPYLIVGAGLLLLIAGSETVLRGGVGLAGALRLSPLLIGLLVVSAGTSAPELVVSLNAAVKGAPDIAVGNVIGSNIVNILLILGLGALIRPLPAPPKVVWRDGLAMLLASGALLVIARMGFLSSQCGWVLIAGFVLYVVVAFITDWRRTTGDSVAAARASELMRSELRLGVSLFLLIFGLAALYVGARFVVNGGIVLARDFHIPESVIGLTVIAVGTSLPELVTTIVASVRRQSGLAIGNLIGSNIFNILLVLGATATIHPIAIALDFARLDVWVMAGAALLLIPLMATGWRVTRPQGFLLVLLYVCYMAYLAWREGLLILPPM